MVEMEPLQIRLSASDREALRIEAAAKQTTIAGIARLAISEHLARSTPEPPAPAPGTVAIPHPAGPAPDPGGVEPAAAPPENAPAGVPRPRGRLTAVLDMLDGPEPAAALAAAAIPLHPGPVWSWPENANVLPDNGPEGGPRRQGRIAAALARLGIGHQRR